MPRRKRPATDVPLAENPSEREPDHTRDGDDTDGDHGPVEPPDAVVEVEETEGDDGQVAATSAKEDLDEEDHELMEAVMPFQVPVPTDEMSRRNKLPPGRKFCDAGFDDLAQWIAKALGRLVPDLQNSLRNYHLAHPTLSVGTACSGTDAPLMVVRAYQEALGKYQGLMNTKTAFRVDHAFSCEKDASRRWSE
eukprot:s2002_g8.t1